MKDSNTIKKFLKAVIVISIVFAFIMPGSATFFNASKEKEYLVKPMGITGMSGDTIYVDDDNTEGPWDGSIDYPYQFIQDPISKILLSSTL